jgi:selenocysteine-specific elongation factor
MRSIIVGTAGHIDHGKTSLVRALTGVDADRLPEEKKRGITIDLGFAELDLGDVRLGFVDVPGHERFVKNMLAGAHGLDLVALVLAADEGVMPQTREHFDICRLLGVKAGLIIVTKTDMVDEDLLELVQMEAAELAAGSFLEDAPILPVSSRAGAGIAELKAALRELALAIPARSQDWTARLPVDRVFTMRGFGAVVTGTLVAGELREGDEMELLPTGAKARVRGLQVHGKAVDTAQAGQRVAVNLGGVDVADIERGMTLAPPGRLRPTQILDARVEVLPDAPRPLRSRARVRVHLGAAEALARVRVLEDGGEIAPGAAGLAQIRLEMPLAAVARERFIIRSYSPSRTIAGGVVLDALASKHRGRELAATRARLNSLQNENHAEMVAVYVASSAEKGLRLDDLRARTGWRDETLQAALDEALRGTSVIEVEGVYLAPAAFAKLAEAALSAIEAHHRAEPLAKGLPRETLRERIFAHAAPETFRAVLSRLETQGRIVSDKDIVRSAAHSQTLAPADQQLKDTLAKIYTDAALSPPTWNEALAQTGKTDAAHARKILQLLFDDGTLRRVTNEFLFYGPALDDLIEKLRAHAAATPDRLIDVAAFKDIAGISRKYAIPLLEYLDLQRVTRRAGDKRVIL